MIRTQVRLAVEKELPVTQRKSVRWFPASRGTRQSLAIYVVLRDVLKLAGSKREARKILLAGKVSVDGKPCKDEFYPISLMSVIEIPDLKKGYRVDFTGGRLLPAETEHPEFKTYKIVKKHVVRGGKFVLTFHDGRNMLGDNSYKVGNSVVLSLKGGKVVAQLPLDANAICTITAGKHIGTRVRLAKVLSVGRKKECEVKPLDGGESFITLMAYLMPIDPKYL